MTISRYIFEETLMGMIDGFIRLQLTAKNLPPKNRFDFLVMSYRELLVDDFEMLFPEGKNKIYLEKIKTSESGPWAKDAFDKTNPYNLI